jgi:hypothetical protein
MPVGNKEDTPSVSTETEADAVDDAVASQGEEEEQDLSPIEIEQWISMDEILKEDPYTVVLSDAEIYQQISQLLQNHPGGGENLQQKAKATFLLLKDVLKYHQNRRLPNHWDKYVPALRAKRLIHEQIYDWVSDGTEMFSYDYPGVMRTNQMIRIRRMPYRQMRQTLNRLLSPYDTESAVDASQPPYWSLLPDASYPMLAVLGNDFEAMIPLSDTEGFPLSYKGVYLRNTVFNPTHPGPLYLEEWIQEPIPRVMADSFKTTEQMLLEGPNGPMVFAEKLLELMDAVLEQEDQQLSGHEMELIVRRSTGHHIHDLDETVWASVVEGLRKRFERVPRMRGPAEADRLFRPKELDFIGLKHPTKSFIMALWNAYQTFVKDDAKLLDTILGKVETQFPLMVEKYEQIRGLLSPSNTNLAGRTTEFVNIFSRIAAVGDLEALASLMESYRINLNYTEVLLMMERMEALRNLDRDVFLDEERVQRLLLSLEPTFDAYDDPNEDIVIFNEGGSSGSVQQHSALSITEAMMISDERTVNDAGDDGDDIHMDTERGTIRFDTPSFLEDEDRPDGLNVLFTRMTGTMIPEAVAGATETAAGAAATTSTAIATTDMISGSGPKEIAEMLLPLFQEWSAVSGLPMDVSELLVRGIGGNLFARRRSQKERLRVKAARLSDEAFEELCNHLNAAILYIPDDAERAEFVAEVMASNKDFETDFHDGFVYVLANWVLYLQELYVKSDGAAVKPSPDLKHHICMTHWAFWGIPMSSKMTSDNYQNKGILRFLLCVLDIVRETCASFQGGLWKDVFAKHDAQTYFKEVIAELNKPVYKNRVKDLQNEWSTRLKTVAKDMLSTAKTHLAATTYDPKNIPMDQQVTAYVEALRKLPVNIATFLNEEGYLQMFVQPVVNSCCLRPLDDSFEAFNDVKRVKTMKGLVKHKKQLVTEYGKNKYTAFKGVVVVVATDKNKRRQPNDDGDNSDDGDYFKCPSDAKTVVVIPDTEARENELARVWNLLCDSLLLPGLKHHASAAAAVMAYEVLGEYISSIQQGLRSYMATRDKPKVNKLVEGLQPLDLEDLLGIMTSVAVQMQAEMKRHHREQWFKEMTQDAIQNIRMWREMFQGVMPLMTDATSEEWSQMARYIVLRCVLLPYAHSNGRQRGSDDVFELPRVLQRQQDINVGIIHDLWKERIHSLNTNVVQVRHVMTAPEIADFYAKKREDLKTENLDMYNTRTVTEINEMRQMKKLGFDVAAMMGKKQADGDTEMMAAAAAEAEEGPMEFMMRGTDEVTRDDDDRLDE